MDNQNRKLELLGNAPIPKALLAMGIPTMIGMLINALSNKSSDVLSTQNQQKAAKSRRDKKREQEEYLEKMREKRKRDEEYLEELREKRKDRDEYISEMSENSSSVVRAYTQAEYDNVDLLSTLDTKI